MQWLVDQKEMLRTVSFTAKIVVVNDIKQFYFGP